MLFIRPANLNDVGVLKALIHEMGEYERLPVVITEESLARNGFGVHPEFRVLIAEWDGHPQSAPVARRAYLLRLLLLEIPRSRSLYFDIGVVETHDRESK